jgi:hypothetical protein
VSHYTPEALKAARRLVDTLLRTPLDPTDVQTVARRIEDILQRLSPALESPPQSDVQFTVHAFGRALPRALEMHEWARRRCGPEVA